MNVTAISRQKPPVLHSPRLVVVGAGVAQSFGAQPLVLSTFSLFVLPLTAATGWKRTAILAAFTACALGMALGMPLAGRSLDRFATRSVALVGWASYCASVALIAVTPLSLPLFYVPYFLIGLFASAAMISFTKAVLSWFDNKRGTGIALMAALMGLGTTFTPLIAARLINTVGFRIAYLGLAVMALLVGLTMIALFVRAHGEPSRPIGRVEPTSSEASELPGLSVREAVRTRHFWLITASLSIAAIAAVGVQANLVPMMLDRGSNLGHATLALSVFGFASLVGRLAGALLDRLLATYVGAVLLLSAAAGLLLIRFERSFSSELVGSAMIGFAFGMEIDLLAFLTSRYFGMRRFGSVFGTLQGAVMVCIAAGPVLVGLAYNRFGTYDAVLPLLAAAFGACASMLLLLGPYPFPAVAGFDRMVEEQDLFRSDLRSRTSSPRAAP